MNQIEIKEILNFTNFVYKSMFDGWTDEDISEVWYEWIQSREINFDLIDEDTNEYKNNELDERASTILRTRLENNL